MKIIIVTVLENEEDDSNIKFEFVKNAYTIFMFNARDNAHQ